MSTSFKNIIFDFGGVIINIDYYRVVDTFKKFGVGDFDSIYSQMYQDMLFDDFEKGAISPHQFRELIREVSGIPLTDSQIDEAWNAILIDLPQKNIDTLIQLKKTHKIFLLSNTNAIHEIAFMKIVHADHGRDILTEIFDKVYFSHQLNMRKPDTQIFERVLRENNLIAEETLFVDDSVQNIDGAQKCGLKTLFVEKGKMVADYFKESD